MKLAAQIFAVGVLLTGSAGVFAQPVKDPGVANLVHLAAQGALEVGSDLLSISMSTSRDGNDAGALQYQLRTALDAALTEAKKAVQPGQLEVRSGNFSLSPRYGRDGKPMGWQGSAELILEGRDFGAITGTVGRIQTLTVGGVSFGLSREQRGKVEAEAQNMAIERFKARAAEIARSFGFTGYSLREVTVTANDQGFAPRPRMMAMEARSSLADAPLPVEAGKTTVLVTVSGSVQLK